MTSHRRARLADLFLDVLARAVREEVRDPRVGFVTLTGVEVSRDMQHAKVFVSSIASAEQRAASVAALNRAAPFLRRLVAAQTSLRHTPDLHFILDESLERGGRVEKILGDIRDAEPGEDGA
jgi:ribosome-binding factor A